MAYIDDVKQKKRFEYINRAAPNSATDITTKTTYVTKIRIANRGAISTFTLADKSSTPVEKYEAVSIGANSVSSDVMSDNPEKFEGGITLTAGDADRLSVTIEGFQEA